MDLIDHEHKQCHVSTVKQFVLSALFHADVSKILKLRYLTKWSEKVDRPLRRCLTGTEKYRGKKICLMLENDRKWLKMAIFVTKFVKMPYISGTANRT